MSFKKILLALIKNADSFSDHKFYISHNAYDNIVKYSLQMPSCLNNNYFL